MQKLEVREAIFKTKTMFDSCDESDKNTLLWKTIAKYMDGEIGFVIYNDTNGKYAYLGLKNEEKFKELTYMIEQDSVKGMYINCREKFEQDWENDEYNPDGCMYLSPEYVELIED